MFALKHRFIDRRKDLETEMRDTARSLLQNKIVDYIIGYEKGSLPLKTKPIFIDKVDEAEKLVLNEFCTFNLVKFIPKNSEDKIGVVAKWCDKKSLNVLFNELQLKEENIVIIDIPCINGVLDVVKIEHAMEGEEVLKIEVTDHEIIATSINLKKTFKRDDLVSSWCINCTNYFFWDYLYLNDVREFEEKAPDERWSEISAQLEKCTRCYSCLKACPLCYCKLCFVDNNKPQWFGRENDVSENMFFHFTRAIHLAGRCSGCGSCTRSCPEGIDFQYLYQKLREIAKVRLKYEPGIELGQKPYEIESGKKLYEET